MSPRFSARKVSSEPRSGAYCPGLISISMVVGLFTLGGVLGVREGGTSGGFATERGGGDLLRSDRTDLALVAVW